MRHDIIYTFTSNLASECTRTHTYGICVDAN